MQVDSKPDEYLLQDGKFTCSTCTPPLTLAADGAFHPVSGRSYADSMAMKVVDDRTVTETAKKDGKVVDETRYSVSPDDKTLTVNFTDSSVAGAAPVTGQMTQTRTAEAPDGAHALSGSWKTDKYDKMSDAGLTVTYKLDGDTLHMTSPDGSSYDAKLDGTEAPVEGDLGGTSVSVTKTGDNAFQETAKRDGKVVSVRDYSVGADGKMRGAIDNKLSGSTIKFEADQVLIG